MTMNCTIICFDYGGYYSMEGDCARWSSKGDRIKTLAIRSAPEEVTYSALVDGISRKIMIDEATTQLKLSYFPMISNLWTPLEISNDDEVFDYLMQVNRDGCRKLLHVELINVDRPIIVVDETQRCVEARRDIGESDVVVGDNEMITLYTDEPLEHHALVDQDHGEQEHFYMHEDNEQNNEQEHFVDGSSLVSTPWEDGVDMKLGQEFGSKDEVKLLVQVASHRNCFEYVVNKTCTKRYVLKCVAADKGCKWYVRVVAIHDSDRWSLVTYRKMHTCSRADASTRIKRRKGSAKIVASILEQEYPGSLETPRPKHLMKLVKTKASVDLSYTTCWRGKQLAANTVRGSPEQSYLMLEAYLYMLQKMNEGTQTCVEWDEHNRFKYMFFALGACIEGFKSMRKVIIVDATHLKHAYGGVLIVAMAQDPDHHHYPIAFGVADGEKEENWMWFMNKLKQVIVEEDEDDPEKSKRSERELVFVSDRNVSLIKSIRVVFPLAHHGYCIYHLAQNVKGSVSNTLKKTVVGHFMLCAEAYTEEVFIRRYSSFMGKYPAAAVYLEKSVEVEKWARCYFPGERYNIATTNSVESINGVFVQARKYTLLPMIDTIIEKIAEWFNKYRKASTEVPDSQKLVPYVNNILESNLPIAKKLVSQELNSWSLEYNVIGEDGKNYVVNLTEKNCSCKYFDIDRYPCVHAIQGIIRLSGGSEVRCYEFASKFYTVDQWVMAYSRTIYPVPHMSTWVIPMTEWNSFREGMPPPHETKKGPPQQTRFLSPGEHGGKGSGKGSVQNPNLEE